jgi:hypothetical protein
VLVALLCVSLCELDQSLTRQGKKEHLHLEGLLDPTRAEWRSNNDNGGCDDHETPSLALP